MAIRERQVIFSTDGKLYPVDNLGRLKPDDILIDGAGVEFGHVVRTRKGGISIAVYEEAMPAAAEATPRGGSAVLDAIESTLDQRMTRVRRGDF